MLRAVCCALAVGLSATPALPQTEESAIAAELREVKQALQKVAELWERQVFVDERSTLVRDVDVLDRNIAFLVEERRKSAEERATVQGEIAALEAQELKLERRAGSEIGDAFEEMLRDKMETRMAGIAAKEQHVIELDRRMGELDQDIARRRAQRAALEEELEAMLPAGS